jgi:hypothetical protein
MSFGGHDNILYAQPKAVNIGCTLVPFRRLKDRYADGVNPHPIEASCSKTRVLSNGILQEQAKSAYGVRIWAFAYSASSCFAAAGRLQTAFGVEISYLCLLARSDDEK